MKKKTKTSTTVADQTFPFFCCSLIFSLLKYSIPVPCLSLLRTVAIHPRRLPAGSVSSCKHTERSASSVRRGVTSESSGVDSHEKILRGTQHWVTMACLYCGGLVLHQTGQALLTRNSAPSPAPLFCGLLHALSRHQAIKGGFAARSKGRKVHF